MGVVRRQGETEQRLPVKKTGFIPRLESLRGVAALTVVGYHVNNQLSGGSANGWLDTLAGRVIAA
jgi:peptidoglycan/LPS O-acetylase OafA/YrhL